MHDYNRLLEALKNGEETSVTVSKQEFPRFREMLIAREDFKHFRGEAKHNGQVIYTYLKEARS